MNFNKEKALDLLNKWDEQNKINQITEKVIKVNDELISLNSVSLIDVAYEYLEHIQYMVKEKEANSLEELFDLVWDNTSILTECNINIYNHDLQEEAFEKLNYIFENHNEYFQNEIKKDVYAVLRAAEYYIMDDFLYEFHNEFQNQFEKEYELENDKEMTL
ncbi:hypothetical protein [Mycoplasmopsis glycophila]|uniref:Uncharacterized protein n=1 Tax=Mycoplasmopsis glycophila TaxID=171285 RepID=A0A449AV30_9BACT|nr:hypothetical protein [Mycoplasmopsis glycophila]VEU70330.1 Uncharacterised protein [Mycoplasmopsis glycophila]